MGLPGNNIHNKKKQLKHKDMPDNCYIINTSMTTPRCS